MTLNGQKALVTGASRGIGACIARELAKAGAEVAINYIGSSAEADELVNSIVKEGGKAMAVAADVSKQPEVNVMFEKVIQQFGTLDILINNAGIQRDASFVDMTLSQWEEVLAVNLTGYFLCAQLAAREFIRRGINPSVSKSAGKIIFISSVHERIPWARHCNYAVSKGGIKILMETLAQELAPLKIRVNSIAPGAIKTDINRQAWVTAAAEKELLKLIPYGRVGTTEDIGSVTTWLASDAADYIQGTTIFVDGGMSLYPAFSSGG